MELSEKERKALVARLKRYRERNAFNDSLQKRVLKENIRRAAVGSRYRQGVIRKAMEAAGVDYKEIRERQTKENAAAREELAELRSEVASNIPKVKARQELWLKKLIDNPPYIARKNSPAPAPNAIAIGQLLEPVLMSFSESTGEGNIESHGPGKNVFKWMWNSFTDSKHSFAVGDGTFTFAMTPPVNGLLGVAMPIAYNGSLFGAIDSNCFDGGNIEVSTSTDLLVDQVVPGGKDLSEEVTLPGLDFLKGRDASCWGQTYTNVFDETDIVETANPLLVIANYNVLITLTVTITATHDNGGVDVDFFSGDQGVTVPGVLFGLTPV
jgi:hypothetical protein